MKALNATALDTHCTVTMACKETECSGTMGLDAPATTTPPPATAAVAVGTYVDMAVSLPMTLAEFDLLQTSFIKGVATAAGVDIAKVKVTGKKEVNARRRLLTTVVQVDFRVEAASPASAATIATNLTATALNTALAAEGLPKSTVVKAARVVPVAGDDDDLARSSSSSSLLSLQVLEGP